MIRTIDKKLSFYWALIPDLNFDQFVQFESKEKQGFHLEQNFVFDGDEDKQFRIEE